MSTKTDLIPTSVVEEVLPLFPACHHDALRKLFRDPTSLGEMERVLLDGLIAQTQRSLTMEVHAEFERRLRDLPPPKLKKHTHMLVGFNPEGEAVAFAYDDNDASTADAALRWVREGRTVRMVTADEGRELMRGYINTHDL